MVTVMLLQLFCFFVISIESLVIPVYTEKQDIYDSVGVMKQCRTVHRDGLSSAGSVYSHK